MCRTQRDAAQAQEKDNNTCPDCAYRHRRRRSKGRFLKFLLFIGLLWITATVSYRHGGKIVGYLQMKRISKEMSLNWEQKDQLIDIFFAARQKAFAQRKQMNQIKQEFYKLMDKDNLTQQELETFIKQSMAQIEKMALTHSAALLKARSVLSPYQRKLLIVRLQQLERKHKGRHWRRYRAYHSSHQHAELYDNAPSHQRAVKETKATLQENVVKEKTQPARIPTPRPASRPTTLTQGLN